MLLNTQFLLIIVNFWLAEVTLSWQIINLLPSRLIPYIAGSTIAREVPATNLEVRMRSLSPTGNKSMNVIGIDGTLSRLGCLLPH